MRKISAKGGPASGGEKIIILNKKEGETPLQALENFRAKHKEYKTEKMTYAGRLDPMASGLLLILSGDETKNKEKYLKLGKEYDFEVLFGFSTDTYDILGKVTKSAKYSGEREELEKIIKQNLRHFTGKFIQKYPHYSSKTVKGKSLLSYAREGIEVEAPDREVFVKKLNFIKLKKINNKKFLQNIEKRIKKVNGDFRQKEILKIWRKNLKEKAGNFFLGSFRIKCGSGTYVRSLADALGKEVGIPALAYSIKRTKIGKHWKV